jgi:hypothetical protein
MALITTDLIKERLAVRGVACRCGVLLGADRTGRQHQAREGENKIFHGSLLNAAA